MLETLPGEIVGSSTEAERLRRFVEAAARRIEPVTFAGESGTGKQTAARLIHEASDRKAGPFLRVDCSLFYERELKRELFGYVAGGSSRGKSRKGLFEFASKGTCYLSRIEELSPGIQTDLLQFLKTGGFARLGDGKRITSGVRIVVSTTKNLAGFVEAGLFDGELYGELSKLSLKLLPLRERKEDVSAIVESILGAHAAGHADRACPGVTPQAMEALVAYTWPGNIDELEKEVLRLLEGSQNPIRPEHLALEIGSCWLGQRGDPEVRGVLDELDGYIREFRVLSRLDLSYGELLNAVGEGPTARPASYRDLEPDLAEGADESADESIEDGGGGQ